MFPFNLFLCAQVIMPIPLVQYPCNRKTLVYLNTTIPTEMDACYYLQSLGLIPFSTVCKKCDHNIDHLKWYLAEAWWRATQMYKKRGGYREVPSIFEEFCKAVARAYNDGIEQPEDMDEEDQGEDGLAVVGESDESDYGDDGDDGDVDSTV